ncbi:MAG: GH39 family glycosyl hydrolase [Verrucomicrobiia bacterium]|jgi:xylan 1,4-beta-xylosidase
MKKLYLPGTFTLLFYFTILANTSAQTGDLGSYQITVFADRPVGKFQPIWRFFGYDEPNYSYMPEGKQLLDEISRLKPQPVFIRTHHLLTSGDGTAWLKWGSTGAYDEDQQGNPIYNWNIMDEIFDSFILRGLKPLVEIGFMPKALSIKPDPYTNPVVTNGPPLDAVGRGWAYPPKDYDKWQKLIEEWVKHSLRRYGTNEVLSWYWELWNEPNIAYWRGTPIEYQKLYDYTAAAVKNVLPQARIGGPHTAGTQGGAEKFLRSFIEHCLYGTNYVSGKKGTPLDFIAFHAKGGTEFRDGHVRMNAGNHLRIIENGFKIMSSYPELKGIPVIIGESDPDGCAACSARFFPQNNYRNTSQYASYTAATFMRKIALARRYGVNLIGAVTWAFEFENQPWFDGLRVLSTRGVPLPVFNAFRMFSLLEPEQVQTQNSTQENLDIILKNSVRGEKPDVDAFATRGSNRVAVLVWNYHDDGIPAKEEQVKLNIQGLNVKLNSARLRHYRIDEHHSNAYTLWKEFGSPQNPTQEQIALLKRASELTALHPERSVELKNGSLTIEFPMPRQSVSLIAIEW